MYCTFYAGGGQEPEKARGKTVGGFHKLRSVREPGAVVRKVAASGYQGYTFRADPDGKLYEPGRCEGVYNGHRDRRNRVRRK